MHRYHVRRALRAGKLSSFEEVSLLAGVVLIVAAFVTALIIGARAAHAGGLPRLLGLIGLAGVAICATSRGARLYRAGVTATLPTSVAKVRVRVRPTRGFGGATIALALVLPFAAGVAVLALWPPAWLPVAAVLLLGCVAGFVTSVRAVQGEWPYAPSLAVASELLQRMCMRADMRAPELIVVRSAVASAWTVGGRIHVTSRLVTLLDDAELEAVLAHEVAHLAHGDAAVMEVSSAPSRVLLAFVGLVNPRLTRWATNLAAYFTGLSIVIVLLGLLCVPPAFVIGWISRLSVLGMSRAREFSADAAAATLTGRPSALASALLKLEHQREWTPRLDLRQADAFAVLCVVGTEGRGLRRLLATHPPTAERVKRLEQTEARIQAGPFA
jgi:heat shock protein HtpX